MAGPDGNKFPTIIKSASDGNVKRNKIRTLFQFQTQIVWKNVILLLVTQYIGLYGGFVVISKLLSGQFGTFMWNQILGFMTGWGVTIGSHRYWSHRSFKATFLLQVILMLLQTSSAENCIYIWARDHRLHHKYSDTDADPHNINRGFFFSHMGWLMMKKHPEVARRGKTIDMSDLEADPLVMFQKKYYYYLFFVIGVLIPVGIPVWLWNESLKHAFFLTSFKFFLTWHVTWCVNSVAHSLGNRPFDKNIQPRDATLYVFYGLGEGWHNYHHSFPWDYKTAELNSDYNSSRTIIELLEKIGWAYDLKTASPELVLAKAKKLGDNSHKIPKTHIQQEYSSDDINDNGLKKS